MLYLYDTNNTHRLINTMLVVVSNVINKEKHLKPFPLTRLPIVMFKSQLGAHFAALCLMCCQELLSIQLPPQQKMNGLTFTFIT